MRQQNRNGKSWWSRLLGGAGGKQRTRRTARLRLEVLEDRLTPATFSDAGTQLNLVLAGERVSIDSTGASYQLTLNTGTWSGTDDANVSGNGTPTLTVTSAGIAAFTQAISVTDSAAGSAVAFQDSVGNSYSNNFAIALNNSPAALALSFTGSTAFQGSSSLNANVLGSIQVVGASLSTTDGNLTLDGTGPNAGGNGNFGTVTVQAATITSTGSGAITLTGVNTSGGTNANAVVIDSGPVSQVPAQILSEGSGAITITGTTPTSTGVDSFGLRMVGAGTAIRSAAGNITIAGTAQGGSGQVNVVGVLFNFSAAVQSTGAAAISITGVGGPNGSSNDQGIQINNSSVTTVNGPITLNGTGGGNAPGTTPSNGVEISSSASVVMSTGTGAITAIGTSVGSGAGVYVTSNGFIGSAVGAINLKGTGTGSAGNIDLINGGTVTSQGGSVLLQATGNVTIDAASSLSAPHGSFTIVGGFPNLGATGASITVLGTLLGGAGNTIQGGPGNDVFQITPVAASGFMLLPGGGTNNEFINPMNISGPVNVSLSAGQGATDILTVQGPMNNGSFTVTPTSTSVNGHVVNYNQFLGTVLAQGQGGHNVFNVFPSTSATMLVNGGNPATFSTNAINFFEPGVQTSSLTNQTPSSGTFLTTGGYLPVNYSNIGSVFAPNSFPVITAPASVTTNKNMAVAITGISVSDPISGSYTVQTILSVTDGTLAVPTNVAGGLNAGQVSGNGSGTVVLTGTIAQIDATLAAAGGPVYTPTTSFTGSDNLLVATSALGNNVVSVVPITVVSVSQQLAALTALAQQDIAAGILSNGQGTSMINSCLKQITETSGIAQITKFISDVQKLVNQGKLSQADANPLIQAAASILPGLTS